MLHFSRAKTAAILLTAGVVCGFAAANYLPVQIAGIWSALALRPDQPGPQMLLEIDRDDVRRQHLDGLRLEVVRTLREAHMTFASAPAVRKDSVEVQLGDGADVSAALATLRGLSQPLGGASQGDDARTLDVADAGGGLVRLTPTDAGVTARTRMAVDQSVPVIERRIHELGLAATVRRRGADRVIVRVAGLGDPEPLLEILGKTAKLEFRLVDTEVTPEDVAQGRVPSGSEVLYEKQGDRRTALVVRKRVVVDGADLVDAQPSYDQRISEAVINFRFSSAGARKFGRATQENVGRPFAIVLDNEVIAAPVIREPILGGQGQISGNFTVRSANNLAILLRAGALPAKLTVIEYRSGATASREEEKAGDAPAVPGR